MTVLSLKNTITQYFNQGIDTAVKHGHRLRETASNAVQKAVNKIPEENRLLVRNATIGTFVLLSTSFAANNLYGAFSPRKFDAIPVPTPPTPTPTNTNSPATAPTPPTPTNTNSPTTASTPTTPPLSTNQQSLLADGSHPINYSNFIPWALGIVAVTVVGLYFTCKRKQKAPLKQIQSNALGEKQSFQSQNVHSNVQETKVDRPKRLFPIDANGKVQWSDDVFKQLVTDIKNRVFVHQFNPSGKQQIIELISQVLSEASNDGETYLHNKTRFHTALPLLHMLADLGAINHVCQLLSIQARGENIPLHLVEYSSEVGELLNRIERADPQGLIKLFQIKNRHRVTCLTVIPDNIKHFVPLLSSISAWKKCPTELLQLLQLELHYRPTILCYSEAFFHFTPILLDLLVDGGLEVEIAVVNLFVDAFAYLMDEKSNNIARKSIIRQYSNSSSEFRATPICSNFERVVNDYILKNSNIQDEVKEKLLTTLRSSQEFRHFHSVKTVKYQAPQLNVSPAAPSTQDTPPNTPTPKRYLAIDANGQVQWPDSHVMQMIRRFQLRLSNPSITDKEKQQIIESISDVLSEASNDGATYLHNKNRLKTALPLLHMLADLGAIDKVCHLLSLQTEYQTTPLHSVEFSEELVELLFKIEHADPNGLVKLFKIQNRNKDTCLSINPENVERYVPLLFSISLKEECSTELLQMLQLKLNWNPTLLCHSDEFFPLTPILHNLMVNGGSEVQIAAADLFVNAFAYLMNNAGTKKAILRKYSNFTSNDYLRHLNPDSKQLAFQRFLNFKTVVRDLILRNGNIQDEVKAKLLAILKSNEEFNNCDYEGIVKYQPQPKVSPAAPLVSPKPGTSTAITQ